MWQTIRRGQSNRSTGVTNMNEHSSRSHMLLCVKVFGRNNVTNISYFGKLYLIDLAGSERLSRSQAEGDRLKETRAINKSLSALGDVIESLQKKNPHVPYRNSKLTFLLQDSLGGHAKTLMFINVSPTEADSEETACSLNFASRVRQVELGRSVKMVTMMPDQGSSRSGSSGPNRSNSIGAPLSSIGSRLRKSRSAGTKTPGTKTPGTRTPGARTPGARTPGARTPGTRTPGTRTPGTRTPGTRTPGLKSFKRNKDKN